MGKKNLYSKKLVWSEPDLTVYDDAKELIQAEFSELFDQKNSSTQVDFFNANVS